MKIKLLATLTFMFLAYVPSVYSQFDITQLEALQKLQQEEQDIDDPVEAYENKVPLDKNVLTDDQLNELIDKSGIRQ